MEKVLYWVTKKTLFIGSLLGVGLAFGIESLHEQGLVSRSLYKIVAEPLFHISIVLLVLAVILIPLRNIIFRSWLIFATFFVFLRFISCHFCLNYPLQILQKEFVIKHVHFANCQIGKVVSKS